MMIQALPATSILVPQIGGDMSLWTLWRRFKDANQYKLLLAAQKLKLDLIYDWFMNDLNNQMLLN